LKHGQTIHRFVPDILLLFAAENSPVHRSAYQQPCHCATGQNRGEGDAALLPLTRDAWTLLVRSSMLELLFAGRYGR